jgi:hypothetical protein
LSLNKFDRKSFIVEPFYCPSTLDIFLACGKRDTDCNDILLTKLIDTGSYDEGATDADIL